MLRIRITKKSLPGKHWLVYFNDNGEKKHIDLSGCAGSFARTTGYVSQDGFRAVGLRYEEGGQLCYEMFNIGHTLFCAPLKPDPIQTLVYLLQGKKPAEAHKAYLEAFEAALHQGGWKTIERSEVSQ